MQGEGEATGKSKIRGKKASSKYNEEISSDSETEGLVSDVPLTLKFCINNSITFLSVLHSWSFRLNSDHSSVWLLSPEVSRKRQSQEERDYGETPQEKKLRLAKLYLDQLKEEGKLSAAHIFETSSKMVGYGRVFIGTYLF